MSDIKIYDPERRRYVNLEGLIISLGIRAVAKKYKVSDSAVRKWRKGIRKPSGRTFGRFGKGLFD